ncbi:MAG: Holliday junction resolvase RuvX [SAR86 cluster bacterium]|uniref:Putative pre-16S rRNA nuclease n=1 Tax=SAR86 cluster bacterium TaxID=2030880 RepID=A0A2A5CJT6_9GAMM|nr:MAG: Holliday junction resolvase RuvX [SAR86 cluster bacterium]
MSTHLTALAFDYGTKKIGVATGQSITQTASPLAVLPARDGVPDWSTIEKLVKEWQPDVFIVGMPFNMDGSESNMTVRAQKFSQRLNGRFNIPCYTIDERLSSREAKDIRKNMAAAHGKKYNERDAIDSIAAQLILESWFASAAAL